MITVIHAEGLYNEGRDSVNEVSLNEFLVNARSIGIYRVNNIHGSNISNMAKEYLGRLFDWQFDIEEDDKIYCTELLYVILRRLDPDIKLNLIWQKEIGKYILPLDFYIKIEYFTEI